MYVIRILWIESKVQCSIFGFLESEVIFHIHNGVEAADYFIDLVSPWLRDGL